MEKQKIPPVTVGQELKLGITRFGSNGDPLLFKDDYVIFLQNVGRTGVHLNQLVSVRITKVQPKYAFCELIKDKTLLDKTEGLFVECVDSVVEEAK